jgi:formylglycine-generating enzyme required for sulfatase activity
MTEEGKTPDRPAADAASDPAALPSAASGADAVAGTSSADPARDAAAPEKIVMKPHPLLDRKKRRAAQLGNARQSKTNPMMNTLEQSRQSHSRIAKICVGVFVALVLVVFVHFLQRHLAQRRQQQARIDEIRASLAAIDSRIANSVGYDQEQGLLDAINVCLRASSVDFAHAEEWQKTLTGYQERLSGQPQPGTHFVVPSAVVDMVNIPRGRFNMGRRGKEPGGSHELNRRLVTMPYEFWLSRTEITNAQFRRFFRQHRTLIPGWENYRFDSPQQPVAYLDWHAASEYGRVITEYEAAAGRLPKGYEYRLPSEAEWEYACRSGTETYFYWGDEFGEAGAAYANILDEDALRRIEGDKREAGMPRRDGYTVTAPVGLFKPNAFGLHDMSGNVWEWCWDWYNPAAYQELYSTAPVQAEPIEAVIQRRAKWGELESVKTTSKVIRGGCWGSVPSEARSATRDSAVPETRNSGIGFRLALAPTIAIIDSGMLEDQILQGAGGE